MQASRIRFTPVRLKARHDGWTTGRQIHFIEQLAATKSLTRACKAVGMSRASAYKLREQPEASEFRSAWYQALEPDFVAERRRSPRALQRLRRGEKSRKVDEMHQMHGAPNSPPAATPNSSTLETLQTYLARLRALDEELGSPRGD